MKRFMASAPVITSAVISVFLSIGLVSTKVLAANLPAHVPGEVLVKMKGDSSFHSMSATLSHQYDVSVAPLAVSNMNTMSVRAEGGVSVSTLISEIKKNPDVEVAEPNWIYSVEPEFRTQPISMVTGQNDLDLGVDLQLAAKYANQYAGFTTDRKIPNDKYFKNNWGLYNYGQPDKGVKKKTFWDYVVDFFLRLVGRAPSDDKGGTPGKAGSDIGATYAWNTSIGSNQIVVAVIDTGVDTKHQDLKNNIYINKGEIAGNGKDDDGNGFVDDVSGFNFAADTGNANDDNGHGTHCAGTIGAEGNNGVGTAGVNWKVKILPVKFLTAQGSGTSKDAIESIDYATKMGVQVMSNSWGGGGYSQLMFDSVKRAQEKGILFVAAAGNSKQNTDVSPSYPAGYKLDNVVSVAATNNSDVIASFSNYGQTSVHLAAPGVNIYSTTTKARGTYATFSGTSMACPHVSGAAALVWASKNTLGYKEVKDLLLGSVDKVDGLSTKTITGGRLNVFSAVKKVAE